MQTLWAGAGHSSARVGAPAAAVVVCVCLLAGWLTPLLLLSSMAALRPLCQKELGLMHSSRAAGGARPHMHGAGRVRD